MLLLFVVACSAPPESDTGPDAGGGGGSGSGSGSADAGVVSATCEGRTAQPRDATWMISAGGMQRTARVHVPASYDPSKRTPLVINAHGLTSNATQQQATSRANAKSDAAGFVVIHPEGTGNSWNAGTCCGSAQSSNVDDAGFMRALIDEAAARLCLDPARVFMMGLSNGGHISYRGACELADKVAAIASIAGVLTMTTCNPSRPVPVLHVHGTADAIVTYDRGDTSVDVWRAKNQCTTMQTSFSNGDASCVTHGGCTAGADVTFCTISGGGHQWPGGVELPFLGYKSDDLDATSAAWDFFVAHPKP
jgi:polyhydroxybutyrate depolymerase